MCAVFLPIDAARGTGGRPRGSRGRLRFERDLSLNPFTHPIPSGQGAPNNHSLSLEGHREDSLDGPGLAGEGQFADDGVIAGPVERDLTAGQQQPQRDRQIEAVGVLLEIGRSEVAKRTFSGAFSAGSWSPDRELESDDLDPVCIREDTTGTASMPSRAQEDKSSS